MYKTAGVICPTRYEQAMKAKEFFMKLWNAPVNKICLENPLPLKVVGLPKESQVIQPYQFGHPYSKRTHLWLKNLPMLNPTEIINDYTPYLPSNTGGAKRGQIARFKNISQKDSSKSFSGISKAMAEQWGWWAIQNLFKNKDGTTNLADAEKFQDALGQWIVDAINEKLKS